MIWPSILTKRIDKWTLNTFSENNMADCECLAGCIFFNDKMASDLPIVADAMKRRLCKGNCAQCARYQVMQALGRENVPTDLIPNQTERVQPIIDEFNSRQDPK